jgi:hypothetical protein
MIWIAGGLKRRVGFLAQRRNADARTQSDESESQNFYYSALFLLAPLRLPCVFGASGKPDLARQLKGVDHVNCPFDM